MSNSLETIIKIKANLSTIFVTLMDPSTSEIERASQFEQTKAYTDKIATSIESFTNDNDITTAQHAVELKTIIEKFYVDYDKTYALNISPAIFNKAQFVTMNNDLTNAMSSISEEFDEPIKSKMATPYSDISGKNYLIVTVNSGIQECEANSIPELQKFLNDYFDANDVTHIIQGKIVNFETVTETKIVKTLKIN